jgi:hypothetical protein
MCKDYGRANTNTCVSLCDGLDTVDVDLGNQVAAGWYLYCTLFFKEICPEAKPFLDADTFEERCGANSGPALGDSTGAAATS